MEPQRFIQSYKCECFQPYNYCNCPYKPIAADILVGNVREVALTLAEVMHLCGIPSTKTKLSVDVVIYYFLHFEEIRTRIDTIPRKRLSKEDLLHDLNRKCCMHRMEAQIAYSIIKRAFRAFYHGTSEGGVPNPLLRHQSRHNPECMWVHAARRTAQVYAAYEGMFLATQKDLERKIKWLYKKLYDYLKSTQQPDENHECACAKCAKRIMREGLKTARVTTRMHSVADPYEEMYRCIVDRMLEERGSVSGNGEMKDMSDKICTCPTLQITESDLRYKEIAVSCNTGCNQGPYACHWFGIDKEEYEADDMEPDIKLPEDCICPPCEDEDRLSCDSECECTCEVCTCETDVDDGDQEVVGVEDNDEEKFMALEEEGLSEEPIKTKGLNLSDKEFSLKYSGCRNPQTFPKVSTKVESITPQIQRTKETSE